MRGDCIYAINKHLVLNAADRKEIEEYRAKKRRQQIGHDKRMLLLRLVRQNLQVMIRIRAFRQGREMKNVPY